MISIIGAGKVGSMAAFNILGRRISATPPPKPGQIF